MKPRFPFATIAIVFFTAGSMSPTFANDLPPRTALDDYIEKPDESYSWQIVRSESNDGIKTIVVDMVSQNWLTNEDVNRTEWQHWVTLSVPENVTSNIGMLFIGGGRNGRDAPSGENARTTAIAKATGTVVAELQMVPNQPLIFHNDGKNRSEDDLIGYTWDQFLQHADPVWLARNPMIKSAIRALDTMTAVMASDTGGGVTVDRFVVAGGSKRGWTTWLTGAMDDRVVAIIPIVIDILNTDVSMRHHFAAYGFWAPSIGNYVDHQIMQRMDHPRLKKLYELIDPYNYRHRLTMPKLLINAAGDQFFLPDSSQFYFDELRGENYLRYVANGDHGLDGTDAVETMIAFYSLIVQGRKPPQFSWAEGSDGSLMVLPQAQPQEVRLWQATNPQARDFRVETLGRKYISSLVAPNDDGMYIAHVPSPKTGWTAYFLELTYDVGAATPLKLTTEVKITPNRIPFADKPVDLPPSVTLVCRAPSELIALETVAEARVLAEGQSFTTNGLDGVAHGPRVYLNWEPTSDFTQGARFLREYLAEQKCEDVTYQLESGSEITLPPETAD